MTVVESAVEVRIEGLSKAFGDHRVLRGVDLEIQRGECVAIVGGSGCGKTVLLNHVLGQLEPDAGRVRVADHARDDAPLVDIDDLQDGELDRIHTHWGVVFQRNALFSGSVYDNIALWLAEVRNLEAEAIAPIARRVLAAVGLETDDAFLDADVGELSGGMAKRLAVARALAMEPRVMCYDEPTTGLDPATAAQIQDMVLATHEDPDPVVRPRTTIIITHDKDLLRRLEPRIVMLDHGRILFDGSFADFERADEPAIRPYFELMPVLHQRPVADA